jgi:hypothetical protein
LQRVAGDDRARALRAARLAVETQHADCIRRATEAAPLPGCSTPANACAVLPAAARAESHAAAMSSAAKAARIDERKATAARRRAEAEASAAQAKRQRRVRVEGDEAEEATKWGGWSHQTFKGFERKAQRLRAVPIDPSMPDRLSTRGGKRKGKRGWRRHWRHGPFGSTRYWARGSRRAVVHMLVALAREFDVVE